MALDKFQPYLFVSAGEQSNKYLTPTITNGIAQFQAQRAQQVTKLLVQIDPVQDLHGQSKPYPPGGDVNKLSAPAQFTQTSNGMTLSSDGVGNYTLTGTATSAAGFTFDIPAAVMPSTAYVHLLNPTATTASSALNIDFYNGSTRLDYVGFTVNRIYNATSTLGGKTVNKLGIRVASGQSLNNFKFSPMVLETGTTTPFTPYSNILPISGHTGLTVTVQGGETERDYPISWQTEAGTVYGGTLDVVSGVLTVDKYLLTCGETITPTGGSYAYETNPNRWQIVLADNYMPDADKIGESISDAFDYYNGGLSQWSDDTFRFSEIQSGGYRLIQFKWADQPTTVEDLKALLAENPFHFVIPLATPVMYQLDPEEVQTLAGYNQIYSDAGPVIDIKF